MFTPQGNMEGWLKELGKARSQGAFVASSGRFPWQKPEPKVLHFLHRRLAWARVAATFAAAAGVAVLFVGPSFIHTHGVAPATPGIVYPLTPERSEEGPAVPANLAVRVDCDFNGDGVVDGLDIQPLTDQVSVRRSQGDVDGSAELSAKFLACVLRSHG